MKMVYFLLWEDVGVMQEELKTNKGRINGIILYLWKDPFDLHALAIWLFKMTYVTLFCRF